MPAAVVAVCGIDGAGKSTLVDALVERLRTREIPATVARKRSPADVEAVEWLYRRGPRATRPSVATGPVADAVRWAYAFDFLRFYREEVCGAPSGVVVADRWTPCAITYAAAGTGYAEAIAQMLSGIPAPDALIYLDVEPAEAGTRIRRRGPQKENESISILAACRDAYDEWLPRLDCPQLRIPTVGPAEALDRADAFVRPYLPSLMRAMISDVEMPGV